MLNESKSAMNDSKSAANESQNDVKATGSQKVTPSSSPKDATTDFFFGAKEPSKKNIIVKRYVRNDFPPVVVAEVDEG